MPTTTATTFTLHEPTPSHPQTHTMTFGRGGAGNRTSSSRPASSSSRRLPPPPSSIPSSISSSHHNNTPNYSTGRGGAGNMHGADEERRVFRFDEELAKEEKACPVHYHVGRGGVGNEVFNGGSGSGSGRRGSKASTSSSRSSGGEGEGSERSSDGGDSGEGVLRGSLEWVRRRGLGGGRK